MTELDVQRNSGQTILHELRARIGSRHERHFREDVELANSVEKIKPGAYDSFQVDLYDLRADSAWDLASKTGKRNFFTLQTLRLIAKWRPDPFRFMQKCKKIGLKALIFVDVLRLDFHPIAGT